MNHELITIEPLTVVKPKWDAPEHIKAYTVTRLGGSSHPPYHSMNLNEFNGDNVNNVIMNRKKVIEYLECPKNILWSRQTHSDICINRDEDSSLIEGDAQLATKDNIVCQVQTADCIPLLVTDKEGSFVCAIHAGWRGLANEIIIKTLSNVKNPQDILVWIGPAINAANYPVKQDVYNQFDKTYLSRADHFENTSDGFLCDVKSIAKAQLKHLGIHLIYDSEIDTYSNPQHFFSYRRDGKTGSMMSMIYRSF